MMKRFGLMIVLLLGTGFAAYAQIEINIIDPEPDELSGDPLKVVATVDSTFELQEVTAAVQEVESSLTYSTTAYFGRFGPNPGWIGTLPLENLPKGAHTLSVTAVDLAGNSASANVSFVYNEPPLLTVNQPIAKSVATPGIHVEASCTDEEQEDCRIDIKTVFPGNEQTLISREGMIDEVIDLAAFDHSTVTLRFEAVDSSGRITTLDRLVHVESNPRLTPIESVPGRILDVGTDRLLFVVSGTEGEILQTFDRNTGKEEVIFEEPGALVSYGYLAPRGAIFVEQSGNVLTARVLHVRNQEVVNLGQSNSAASLLARGRYAIWNEGMALIRRDLEEGTNVVVSRDAGNWAHDVTSEGVVAYWTSRNEYQIFRFENGENVSLTQDRDLWNTYPRISGSNTIYRKSTPCCVNQTYQIALHDGVTETILTPARPYMPAPGLDYSMNGNWVAFAKAGSSQQNQIWVAPIGGTPSQRTFFGTDSRIVGLNDRGDLIIRNAQVRYISHPNGEFHELGRYLGQTLWFEDRWQVVLGRTLFVLNTGVEESLLIGIARQEDGRYLLTLQGRNDREVTLQMSEDLTHWSDVQTIPANDDFLPLPDLPQDNNTKQFFRVLAK